MNQPMLFTFIILICMLALMIQGKFRADFIALSALLILSLIGILTPEEALAGFSNPVVIMLAGLFIVGAGIVNSGLVDYIGKIFVCLGKGSEVKLIILVMLISGLLSGILSGTVVVALLLPIVMSMALQDKHSPSRFLIPLAYASSIGGMMTLIGTTPNLLVSELLRNNEYTQLNLFDFTPIGLIILTVSLLFMLTIGRKLLPNPSVSAKNSLKGLSSSELAGMYKVYDRLHYVRIPAHSDMVGERLTDLKLSIKYEITVIEIKRRAKEKQLHLLPKNLFISPKADEILHPEDMILVFGEDQEVERLAKDYELESKWYNLEEVRKHFVSRKFGLTEIIIMPHSDYENQTLHDLHFREKYQCNVLAINRQGEYIQADLGTELLKPGDALLIHGEWKNIEIISSDLEDMLVIGSASQEAESLYSGRKAMLAAVITVLLAVMLSVDSLDPTLSVLTAAFLMVITGCIRSMEEAYQRINWESILLIGAMISIATAIEKTGGNLLLSSILEETFRGKGPLPLLAGLYLVTTALTQFISNGTIVVIIAPIAFMTAEHFHYSPIPFLICVAAAGSMALLSASTNPTNALVMTAGEYNHKDFALLGSLLQLVIGIILVLTIPLFFPF